MVSVDNNIVKYRIQVPASIAMTRVMALMLKLVMLVMLTYTNVAHKYMKALHTKRGGADAECAMNNETLHCL